MRGSGQTIHVTAGLFVTWGPGHSQFSLQCCSHSWKSLSEASFASSRRWISLAWLFLSNLFYFLLGSLLLDKGLEPGWLGFRLTKRNTFIVNINGKPWFLQGLGLAVWADQKQLGLISQYSLELRQLTAILVLTKQHKKVGYRNVKVSLSVDFFYMCTTCQNLINLPTEQELSFEGNLLNKMCEQSVFICNVMSLFQCVHSTLAFLAG